MAILTHIINCKGTGSNRASLHLNLAWTLWTQYWKAMNLPPKAKCQFSGSSLLSSTSQISTFPEPSWHSLLEHLGMLTIQHMCWCHILSALTWLLTVPCLLAQNFHLVLTKKLEICCTAPYGKQLRNFLIGKNPLFEVNLVVIIRLFHDQQFDKS